MDLPLVRKSLFLLGGRYAECGCFTKLEPGFETSNPIGIGYVGSGRLKWDATASGRTTARRWRGGSTGSWRGIRWLQVCIINGDRVLVSSRGDVARIGGWHRLWENEVVDAFSMNAGGAIKWDERVTVSGIIGSPLRRMPFNTIPLVQGTGVM